MKVKKFFIILFILLCLFSLFFIYNQVKTTGNVIYYQFAATAGDYPQEFIENFNSQTQIATSSNIDFSSQNARSTGNAYSPVNNADSSLVLHYTFDDENNLYADSTNNNNIGECGDECYFLKNNFVRGALELPTDGQGLIIPTSSSIQGITDSGSMTIAYWVRRDDIKNGGQFLEHNPKSNWAGSLMKMSITGSLPTSGFSIYFPYYKDGVLNQWNLYGGGTKNDVQIGDWNHVAVSIKKASANPTDEEIRDQIRIYWNGEEYKPGYSGGVKGPSILNFTDKSLGIMKGGIVTIDEVTLWNKALSQSEVQDLTNVQTESGKIISTSISTPNGLDNLYANWDESISGCIELSISFNNSNQWYVIEKNTDLNLLAVDGLGAPSFRYQARFLEQCTFDNLQIKYETNDQAPPQITVNQIAPTAYEATVFFNTSEYTKVNGSVFVNGQWKNTPITDYGIDGSIEFTGLAPGTSYQYEIQATDFSNNSYIQSGSINTVNSCYVVDICGNAKDDDCNGEVDENACLEFGDRIGYKGSGELIDVVPFGANHWDEKKAYTYQKPWVYTTEDNAFGEHNGRTTINGWGDDVINQFNIPANNNVTFEMSVIPNEYHVIQYDNANVRPNNGFDYELLYSFDNGETWNEMNVPNGSILQNSYLIYVPEGITKVLLRTHVIEGGIYDSGVMMWTLKTKAPKIEPLDNEKPNFFYDNISKQVEVINNEMPTGYRSRLTGGWGSAPGNAYASQEYSHNARDNSASLNKAALACVVTKKDGYCDSAKRLLMGYASYPEWSRSEQGSIDSNEGGFISVLYQGEMLHGVTLAYDLIYDELTPQERGLVIEKLAEEAHYLYMRSQSTDETSVEHWWHTDYHTNNWAGVAGGGLGFAGLLLKEVGHPMGEVYEQRGNELSLMYIDKLADIKPTLDEPSKNKVNHGTTYESIGYMNYPNLYVLAYWRAKDRKENTNWLNYEGKLNASNMYPLYSLGPQNINSISFDDYYGNPHEGGDSISSATDLMIASFYNNPYAYWYWNERSGTNKNVEWVWVTGGNALDFVYSLLFYPGDRVEQISPDEANFTLGRWFQYGKMISRTGWDRNATVLVTQGGQTGMHDHNDQGSFMYGAYGNMLITERKGPASTSHSLIAIDGHEQKNVGRTFDSAKSHYLHSDIVDWHQVDARIAYNVTRYTNGKTQFEFEKAFRNWFYRRGDNHYVVMFDKMKPSDEEQHTYDTRIFQDERHTQVTKQTDNHYRFIGDRKILHGEKILNGRTADVDLDVYVTSASPFSTNTSVPFKVKTSTNELTLGYLLYPDYVNNSREDVIVIEDSQAVGFRIGEELILQPTKNSSILTYAGQEIIIKGEIAFLAPQENTYSLVKGTELTYDGTTYIKSKDPINAILQQTKNGTIITIGDEAQEYKDSITNITIGGLNSNDDYTLFIDGINYGVITTNEEGETIEEISIDNELHKLELEGGIILENKTLGEDKTLNSGTSTNNPPSGGGGGGSSNNDNEEITLSGSDSSNNEAIFDDSSVISNNENNGDINDSQSPNEENPERKEAGVLFYLLFILVNGVAIFFIIRVINSK